MSIDVGTLISNLLANLCITFTLITLFTQFFGSRLELDHKEKRNGLGILLFSLLALFTTALPLLQMKVHGVMFDIELAVLILATAYLDMLDSVAVALFTIILRVIHGGAGLLWFAGVFVCILVSYYSFAFFLPKIGDLYWHQS